MKRVLFYFFFLLLVLIGTNLSRPGLFRSGVFALRLRPEGWSDLCGGGVEGVEIK